jgi:2'-hydroxyisoflavone reductase
VIDTSGYLPRHVRLSAGLLAKQVPHYLFISTVSVYQSFTEANDEHSPLGTLDDPTVETVDGQTYGPLKALCEEAARSAYADQYCTILRPGLIVGPYDNTDRFTYWPARAAQGGPFIAPGGPQDPIQIIDARDLAAYSIACLESRTTGVFNVISPPGLLTMGDLITGAITTAQAVMATPNAPAMGSAPQAIWLPAEFLAQHNVSPWSDMPVWVPDSKDDFGFARTSVSQALQSGLSIRPLPDTLIDTLRWHLSRPEAERNRLRAGLSAAREAEVLALWNQA